MREEKIGNYMRSNNIYRILLCTAIFALAGGVLLLNPLTEKVSATDAGSGSIAATNGAAVTPWQGNAVIPNTAANGEPSCTNGDTSATNCDTFTLNVAAGDWSDKRIRIQFNWALPADDYDMVVRRENGDTPGMQGDGVINSGTFDPIVGTSGNGTNTFEEVLVNPSNDGGTYYIRSIYFAVANASNRYTGTAVVEQVVDVPAPASTCTVPQFDNYTPPIGFPRRDGSGEPSIGVNWNTGNVMTMSRLKANTTVFDDSTSPADPNTVEWIDRPIAGIVTGFDPILFTDSVTGRTIGGELVVAGGTTQGSYSDDDFETQGPNFTTGGAVQGFDHQTIGGGPPKVDPNDPVITARQPTTSYPHLFYYASQQIAYGTVSTSFDGGATYGTAVTAYTLQECNGLHGHIKVAPDGTVYLPNKNCGGQAAVVVSEDNGLTWDVRKIPTSSSGDNDPSVAIGAGGRVYVSYTAADKHPRVAVSDDKGLTWRDDFDLALSVTPNNLTAAVFPAVVAGDNDRATVFFLATDSTSPNDPTGIDGVDSTGADPDPNDNFLGTWYPYMAVTCDGGQSWSVVKADNSPANPGLKNPAQQGVVCTNGTTCPDDGTNDTRNLLDFNDMTVDSRGRILAVYADGCNFGHPCSTVADNTVDRTGNQSTATLTIIRQRSGSRLFSAFDPGGPAAPSLSPPVQVEKERKGYSIQWATPDDGGSPLTGYKIYRGSEGQGEKLIAETKTSQNRYVDKNFDGSIMSGVYYRVTATNRFGESPRGNRFFAKVGDRPSVEKNAVSRKKLGE